MTSHLKFRDTALDGVAIIERSPIEDSRGTFQRIFCERDLESVIGSRTICQMNHSLTRWKGSVRGLHFQEPPYAELKIVTCLQGAALDIAVDLRQDSITYLCHVAVEISPANRQSLVIPEGVAHGFQTLEDNTELIYMHTAAFNPGSEGGFNISDPSLDIRLPLSITDISDKDKQLPSIPNDYEGIEL